jgi:hypothetical protein
MGDILVQDFIEHYNNLTVKAVMLLKYVQSLEFQPTFIIKVIPKTINTRLPVSNSIM